jgi:pimeloyl-ACP methyl ester carboxylesterase
MTIHAIGWKNGPNNPSRQLVNRRLASRRWRSPSNWLTMLLAASFAFSASAGHGAQQELPPKQDVTLRTKDGVNLRCAYYPGTQGKDSVPVIFLHGWKGQGAEYSGLVNFLRENGHPWAMMVPDLRGHGGSTTRTARLGGPTQEIQLDRMRPNDIRDMFAYDLGAMKKFLMEKHNAGELNIELLCVVGAEMGATVAANWAAVDWSWPRLPTYKQGQDVRALVLLSPPLNFRGVNTQQGLNHPSVRRFLSVMVIHGQQGAAEARRVHDYLKRWHDPAEDDVELVSVDSPNQGVRLLDKNVAMQIAGFVQRQLVDRKQRYPWRERINPLAD